MQKTKNNPKNNFSAFTLIEVVISLAMVAIVTSAALQLARFSDTHKSLTLALDQLRAALRSAQSSALSTPNPQGRHVCGYGLYVKDTTTFELFYTFATNAQFSANPNYCSSAGGASLRSFSLAPAGQKEVTQTLSLESGLQFSSEVGKSVFFITPYGETYDNAGTRLVGTITYTIQNTNNSSSKSISVNAFGKID